MQMQPQRPVQPTQPVAKPWAQRITALLLGNLTANNANPEAIQAQDDERQALAAKSQQKPAARPQR